MSEQNEKVSDQTKNTPEILSDGKKFEAKLNVRPDMMNPIMLLSNHKLKMPDQTFNPF